MGNCSHFKIDEHDFSVEFGLSSYSPTVCVPVETIDKLTPGQIGKYVKRLRSAAAACEVHEYGYNIRSGYSDLSSMKKYVRLYEQCKAEFNDEERQTYEQVKAALDMGLDWLPRPGSRDKEKRVKPTRPAAVYLMAMQGRYKIGVSVDPERRRSQLESGLPDPLEILDLHWCDSEDEAYSIESKILTALAEYRTRGEWFDFPVNPSLPTLVSQFSQAVQS